MSFCLSYSEYLANPGLYDLVAGPHADCAVCDGRICQNLNVPDCACGFGLYTVGGCISIACNQCSSSSSSGSGPCPALPVCECGYDFNLNDPCLSATCVPCNSSSSSSEVPFGSSSSSSSSSDSSQVVNPGSLSSFLSSDGGVGILFDNVTAAGSVDLRTSESGGFTAIYLGGTFDFSGGFKISINSEDIDPAKNPVLIHVRYDETLANIFYENVTTEAVQGRLTGVASSLGFFLVVKDGSAFDPCVFSTCLSGQSVSGLITDENASGSCTFAIAVEPDPPPPCPGSRTRGNWTIQDGVPTPRLLSTACDCYVPSFVTVDMVVGAAGAVGAARGAVCAGWSAISRLGIPSLRTAISSLRTLIDDTGRQIANFADDIRTCILNISGWSDELADCVDDIRNAQTEVARNVQDLMDVIYEIAGVTDPAGMNHDEYLAAVGRARDAYNEWRTNPALPDPNGWFRSWTRLWDESRTLGDDIERLTSNRNDLINKIGNESGKKINREGQKAGAEAVLDSKNLEVTRKVAELAAAEGAETSLLSKIGRAVIDGAASMATMYAFVNEISVKKTCPGQELNEYTCECCDNCTGGKIHPVGQGGAGLDPSLVGKVISCDCVCPSDKEPCLAFGVEACFEPCGSGKIRAGANCECVCLPGKELCGDTCYDPCTGGKVRNPSTCGCDCPEGVVCNTCEPVTDAWCTYTYNYREAGGGIYVLGWYMSDEQCGRSCKCPPSNDPQLPSGAAIGQRINLQCVPTNP